MRTRGRLRLSRRPSFSWGLAGLALVFVLAGQVPARPVQADAHPGPGPDDAARVRAHDHFVLGLNFYRARSYREALRELELASALAPNADVWINIARAHEELGEYSQAVNALERCLHDYGQRPEADSVRAQIARVQQLAHAAHQREVDQPRYGSLRVHGRSLDARVFVDGQVVGPSSLAAPLLLSEGKHRFDVVEPLHVPLHAMVDIQPGLLTTAYADLRPTTQARTRATGHGLDFALFGVAGASAVVSATFAALSIAQRSEGSIKNSQAWAQRADIALAGTALCALAAALLFHGVERSAQTELTPATVDQH